MNAIRCAFYGDDFTGAADTLATFAQAGLSALLFLGVPNDDHLARAGALDVVGIAGAARSMDDAAMAAELAPVAQFFASLGAPVVHYKCCSTFDSSPAVGNLASALRLLQPAVSSSFLPIVGGQPNLGRYCVFGNLFAAAGVDGEVHRIDRHPTMSRHPVTPMLESDLRRHLAGLGIGDVALTDWRQLDDGAPVLQQGPNLFDVLHAGHLQNIGGIIWRHAQGQSLLALGASSVAQALIAHWRASEVLPTRNPLSRVLAAPGPVFVVAGSRSPITAAQIAQAGPAYRRIAVDTGEIVASEHALHALADACVAQLDAGRSVIASTGDVQAAGPAAADVAKACGRLVTRVLSRAPQVRRVGIAGGDTSSWTVRQMNLWGLAFAGWLAPGVPLVRARSTQPALDGLELVLKGGQMGPPQLFEMLRAGA